MWMLRVCGYLALVLWYVNAVFRELVYQHGLKLFHVGSLLIDDGVCFLVHFEVGNHHLERQNQPADCGYHTEQRGEHLEDRSPTCHVLLHTQSVE